jgi:hypothetical protein
MASDAPKQRKLGLASTRLPVEAHQALIDEATALGLTEYQYIQKLLLTRHQTADPAELEAARQQAREWEERARTAQKDTEALNANLDRTETELQRTRIKRDEYGGQLTDQAKAHKLVVQQLEDQLAGLRKENMEKTLQIGTLLDKQRRIIQKATTNSFLPKSAFENA